MCHGVPLGSKRPGAHILVSARQATEEPTACVRSIDLLSASLMIPLVYCHIKSFQRASSMEKPFPGGEERRDGRASYHEACATLGSLLLPGAAPGVSLSTGCWLTGASSSAC